jgi:hypothetical protein
VTTKRPPPQKPTKNVVSMLKPPRGMPEEERVEFVRLVEQHRHLLALDDAAAVVELARARVLARVLTERLKREGPTVKSRSGARKRNPTLAALTTVQAHERGLVALLGLQKPNVSLARQQHVVKERERIARIIDTTFAAEGGALLAGHADWVKESHQPGQISQTAMHIVRNYFGTKS